MESADPEVPQTFSLDLGCTIRMECRSDSMDVNSIFEVL